MIFEASCGEARYRVWGSAVPCGRDCSIVLLGGTRPHVGAVSLAVYESARRSATVSTVTVFSHRDDVCAAACAKRASAALHCTVSVSVGIHVDDAEPHELQLLLDNADRCCGDLIAQLAAAL